MSFKTGDLVKVVKALDVDAAPYVGKVGKFDGYGGTDSHYDFWVQFPFERYPAGFYAGELEAVQA